MNRAKKFYRQLVSNVGPALDIRQDGLHRADTVDARRIAERSLVLESIIVAKKYD